VNPARDRRLRYPLVEIAIEAVEHVDDDLTEAMRQMIPQLSTSAAPVSRELLEGIVATPSTILLVARRESTIVGSLTLATY
jgi:hypothetical protein